MLQGFFNNGTFDIERNKIFKKGTGILMKKSKRIRNLLGAITIAFAMVFTMFGSLGGMESVSAAEDSETVYAVFRLYAPSTGEHLYTSDPNEVDVLSTAYGWEFEGIGWFAPEDGVPVYRLFNAGLNNHLYTSDTNEVSVLTKYHGWELDNNGDPLFYSGGTVNIYRLYNENLNGMHLLSTDENEYNVLPSYGWEQEGAKLLAAADGIIFATDDSTDSTTNSTPASDIGSVQQQVVDIVNTERAKYGLNPLSSTVELQNTAYVRVQETVTKFSHTRPDGRDCFTAFDENGVDYMAAGENIAMGYTDAQDVMDGWMNSPGHRANILDPDFNHIGVGYYVVDGYAYWVQVFTD